MKIQWNNIGNVDFEKLDTYKKQFHSVVRLIAIVEKGITDCDPNSIMLTWLPEFNAVSTHKCDSSGHSFKLAVVPEDLTLLLIRDNQSIENSLSLDGVSQREAYEWIKSEINLVGIDNRNLSEDLPFNDESFNIDPDLVYEIESKDSGLELTKYYSNAFELLNHFKNKRDHTTELLISPLYLNLETSFPIHKNSESNLSIGFSPGDKFESEPYFYVSRPSSEEVLNNKLLPLNGANWVKEEAWFGCKYSAKVFSRTESQLEICKDFLHDGQGYIKAISA
ncbi:hypothetical protein [Sediminitomix flava]|nr:hypothetical protein [Sediminitomix flava]